MKEKVYVVVWDSAFEDGVVYRMFDTLEKAREFAKEALVPCDICSLTLTHEQERRMH